MHNAIKEIITGMTDHELLEAVEETYAGYTREALEIAMAELKRRGLSFMDKTADYPRDDEEPEEEDEEDFIEGEYDCPQCKAKMESGSIYLETTFWGMLFRLLSHKHCYFSPAHNMEAEEKVIDNSESKSAYRCRKCGLILFETTDRDTLV